MDVKSAFLYGTIEEEVYVCQPPGFKDPDYPDKVYKVVKALYGLHQAHRAWYETLANYLLENGFQRGKIDQTLFIKWQKGNILLVQIYVDDIIFGSTNKDLCIAFEKLMKDTFQMSSMDGKSASTPIDTEKPLLKDPDGEDVDVHTYRSMIGSLMYLTSSRPNIMFAVCACAHFQVTPKALHLHAVKRIFRYLKGKPHLGLLYPKDLPFNLVAYSDNDYAGASLDRNSTTGGCQFLGCRLISWQCKKQTVVATSSTKAEYIVAASCCVQQVDENVAEVNVDDVPAAGVADEGVASVNVDVVLTAVDEPSIPSPLLTTQPPPPSQDLPSTSQVQPTPPPSPIAQPSSPQQQPHSSQDAEISMDLLHTLMETCITLTRTVEHLEQDKIAQALEITRLKQKVKKLERRNKLKVTKLRRLKKVGTTQRVDTSDDIVMHDVSKQGRIISSMDADVDVTLNDVFDIAKEVAVDAEIEESADVDGRQAESQAQIYQIDLEYVNKVLNMQDDEFEPAKLQEVVEVVTTTKLMTKVVTAASATITTVDTLIPVTTIPAAASTLTTTPSTARWRKEVVIRDPEETDTPSIIIHSEAKSTDKGKGILRKPQTEAQARKNMMIYLRNMAGFKMYYFKGIKYDDIQEEDSRALNRISESQAEKATKKQKLDEEVAELKRHLQIVPNDEDDVYTEATPLSRKVSVVDYEIYTENNKPYYKIIRADRSPRLFLSFLTLLKNFDREDLEVLWQLVKERFASSNLKNFSGDFLLTTLTYMFEKPDIQAQVWKNQRTVHGLANVKS
nr:hypothetical protein [Tanacetum cinerariifolium]